MTSSPRHPQDHDTAHRSSEGLPEWLHQMILLPRLEGLIDGPEVPTDETEAGPPAPAVDR